MGREDPEGSGSSPSSSLFGATRLAPGSAARRTSPGTAAQAAYHHQDEGTVDEHGQDQPPDKRYTNCHESRCRPELAIRRWAYGQEELRHGPALPTRASLERGGGRPSSRRRARRDAHAPGRAIGGIGSGPHLHVDPNWRYAPSRTTRRDTPIAQLRLPGALSYRTPTAALRFSSGGLRRSNCSAAPIAAGASDATGLSKRARGEHAASHLWLEAVRSHRLDHFVPPA
jgi:hypothetical protein